MKNLNKKSKGEQLFILVLMCIGIFGILCLTGCGGNSCETIKCGSNEVLGLEVKYISVPGCGGCLTSGKGCNMACWPQSIQCSVATYEDKEKDSDDNGCIVGCNSSYFGDGCLGCAQTEKDCYTGCINLDGFNDNMKGFFYGSTDHDERFIGYSNGCVGCFKDEAYDALLNLLGKWQEEEQEEY